MMVESKSSNDQSNPKKHMRVRTHLNDDHDQIFRALSHQAVELAIGGDFEHETHQHGNVRIDDRHLGARQLVKHLRVSVCVCVCVRVWRQ
jgi:hypothetical protein